MAVGRGILVLKNKIVEMFDVFVGDEASCLFLIGSQCVNSQAFDAGVGFFEPRPCDSPICFADRLQPQQTMCYIPIAVVAKVSSHFKRSLLRVTDLHADGSNLSLNKIGYVQFCL